MSYYQKNNGVVCFLFSTVSLIKTCKEVAIMKSKKTMSVNKVVRQEVVPMTKNRLKMQIKIFVFSNNLFGPDQSMPCNVEITIQSIFVLNFSYTSFNLNWSNDVYEDCNTIPPFLYVTSIEKITFMLGSKRKVVDN